ncbi:MAG: hypothetical protein ACRDSP_09970 [Pseudonocardiaceae bacterium]
MQRDPILVDSLPAAVSDSPHASITGTFSRKFLGPGSQVYLSSLGEGWAEPGTEKQIIAAFTSISEPLTALLTQRPDRTVLYGDLKPEHILLGHDGRQIWLDPGLQHCDPYADFLVTRLLECHFCRADSEDALRRLLTLWVADWANYLATGLSLPPDLGLPLPPTLLDAVVRAEPLLQVARAAATTLVGNPALAWEIMLSGVHQLAARPCG